MSFKSITLLENIIVIVISTTYAEDFLDLLQLF